MTQCHNKKKKKKKDWSYKGGPKGLHALRVKMGPFGNGSSVMHIATAILYRKYFGVKFTDTNAFWAAEWLNSWTLYLFKLR